MTDRPRALSRRLELFLLFLLLAATLVSRVLTSERYISGYDPGNYWLALDDYSIEAERPHPPGYPVYVGLLHAGEFVFGDRHTGMIAVEIGFTLLALAGLYFLCRRWLGPNAALIACLLLATNPLFWLYGSTSENYAYDALFGVAAIAALSFARRWQWLAVGLLFGVAAGVRGASVVLMAPVALYILVLRMKSPNISWRELVLSVLGVLIGLATWIPPVAAKEGGLAGMARAMVGVSPESAGPWYGNVIGMVTTFVWMMSLAWVYVAFRWRAIIGALRRSGSVFDSPRPARVIALWVGVPVVFFVAVIYAKGYGLLVLPAMYIVVAWLLMHESPRTRTWVLSLLVAGNLAVFFAVPYEPPPSFTALAPRNRTLMQRVRTVAGRSISVYLPSYQRIVASDDIVDEALKLVVGAVGSGGDTTLVVIDPSVGSYFAGSRVMQVYMPQCWFAQPSVRAARLVAFHHGIEKIERLGDAVSYDARRLLLLTDRGLAGRYVDLGPRALGEGKYFSLLEFDPKHHGELRSRIDELFIRSE